MQTLLDVFLRESPQWEVSRCGAVNLCEHGPKRWEFWPRVSANPNWQQLSGLQLKVWDYNQFWATFTCVATWQSSPVQLLRLGWFIDSNEEKFDIWLW